MLNRSPKDAEASSFPFKSRADRIGESLATTSAASGELTRYNADGASSMIGKPFEWARTSEKNVALPISSDPPSTAAVTAELLFIRATSPSIPYFWKIPLCAAHRATMTSPLVVAAMRNLVSDCARTTAGAEANAALAATKVERFIPIGMPGASQGRTVAPMNRRELLAASLGLAAGARPWALSAQTLEHFAAGATPTEGDSLIFLAQSEGYFGRAGLALDVQRMSNGEASAAALASGDIAIGGMNTMSLAIAHQNGIPLKAVAGGVMYLSTHSGSQMMVAKTSSATSGRDLVGKIFAVNVLHGSAQLSSQAWIDKHGGDSTSVRWIEMPFSVMEAALVAGRIDAALIAQPFATTALATCRSLGAPNDAIAPRFLNSCYVATPAWLSTHHDEAVRSERR